MYKRILLSTLTIAVLGSVYLVTLVLNVLKEMNGTIEPAVMATLNKIGVLSCTSIWFFGILLVGVIISWSKKKNEKLQQVRNKTCLS